ncbi:hypothetical protein NC653_019760 [Populus alba x Populus x berolinensis]|uniref:Uncharacterized protein n=1 Tax=Populus alba x Populus x berolinensis TaxID=444605 RepID=A0AAD6QJS9_9ROSI|nr:hypothetical protein NC653_019760 [Populus alba x Populus x berolinensis]
MKRRTRSVHDVKVGVAGNVTLTLATEGSN